MSTIAIAATFPPSESFGGPARIHHMGSALRAAGHQVIYIVISSQHLSHRLGPNDLVRVVERPFRAEVDHIYGDVDLARRAAHDRSVGVAVAEHLARTDARAVILEHPFLIDSIGPVCASLGLPLVYSCANIEHRLLHDLERFMFDWRRPTDRFEEVRALETRAIEAAAIVTTICPTDQAVLKSEFGADSVLVPNGSILAECLPATTRSTRRAGEPVDFAVAGSAYWPNVEGLSLIAQPSLAFLPPTSRIHVAGSMSRELLKLRSIERRYATNSSRLALRGFLETDELVATFQAARAILVPVFTGEGSNLKAADALASGRPVIMTARAVNGYEDILELDDEGVTVTADADEFRAAMLATVTRERSPDVGARRRAALAWNTRTAPLVTAVKTALNSSPATV
jgi:glycosyltransferase involved in cell wall biosynthesis